jgi:transposase-like protein
MERRRQDRESYWRDIVQQQAESGLSVAQFCRQESLSAASLYAWRRKLQERDAAICEISAQRGTKRDQAAQLVPVRIETGEPTAAVRILLPQGVAIDAPVGMDRGALIELLTALREAHRC